jgi:hypothetical protein
LRSGSAPGRRRVRVSAVSSKSSPEAPDDSVELRSVSTDMSAGDASHLQGCPSLARPVYVIPEESEVLSANGSKGMVGVFPETEERGAARRFFRWRGSRSRGWARAAGWAPCSGPGSGGRRAPPLAWQASRGLSLSPPQDRERTTQDAPGVGARVARSQRRTYGVGRPIGFQERCRCRLVALIN